MWRPGRGVENSVFGSRQPEYGKTTKDNGSGGNDYANEKQAKNANRGRKRGKRSLRAEEDVVGVWWYSYWVLN